MASVKILPMCATIPIHYDPGVDAIIELLSPYPKLYEQRLAENFIDTVIYDNEVSDNVSFYKVMEIAMQDCILQFNLPFDIARASISDMCDHIVDLINREYYVHFLCDTFWVNGYVSYQKSHIEHPALIYGYDCQKRVFFARDYFNFQTLSNRTIAFEDIHNSYVHGKFVEHPGEHAMLNTNILFGRKIVNLEVKPLNIPLIKRSLENFLEDFPYTNSEGLYCGIQFFKFLVKRYQADPTHISTKHCHFIYAHMQFMLYRAEVLQKYWPCHLQQYEMVIILLKELLLHVQTLEMRILKSQVSSAAFKDDYAEELMHIKKRYTEIIKLIIKLL